MLQTVLYFAALSVLVAMAVVAAMDRQLWLGIVGTAGIGGVVVCAIALFEYPPRPPITGMLMCSAVLSVWSYSRWRKWSRRRDRRAEDQQ